MPVIGWGPPPTGLIFLPGCDAVLAVHNGTLTSPAYGSASYPNNQVCTYRIRHPEGNGISLMFLDMNLHPSDFVEVRIREPFLVASEATQLYGS